MMADKPDLWDKAALDFVMNYKGGPRLDSALQDFCFRTSNSKSQLILRG